MRLLSPQGKILFDFFVLADGDGYLLDVASAQAEALRQRLGFYRLRAAVTIEAEPSLKVAASWGEAALANLPAEAPNFRDPRLDSMGARVLLPAMSTSQNSATELATEAAYHAHRIAEGVPEGSRDYAFGDAFPHEAMFDQLHGVDFQKGCFVGQEVVSRMQHRGTARKRIVGVEGEGALPPSGAEIFAATMPIGTLGSINGSAGLALVRLDRAEEPKLKAWRCVPATSPSSCASLLGRACKLRRRRRREHKRAQALSSGRGRTRFMSATTTRSGACRSTTTARSTRSLCSTASRPGSRGSRSCASARTSAARSTASSRSGSRASTAKKIAA